MWAAFASNVLTGIGMGTTDVTATLGAVVSDPTSVIVKPPGDNYDHSDLWIQPG